MPSKSIKKRVKRSSPKRSVKRSSPKRSVKRSSPKRSVKRSSPKRSVKRSVSKSKEMKVFSDPIPDQSIFVYKKTKKLSELQTKLKKLFSAFNKIVKKYSLTYCLDSGTLLGAVRHANVIPWDDDVDVQMTKEEIKELYKHKKEIKEMGYHLGFRDKIYRFEKFREDGKYGKDPYIDIFEVREKDGRIEYSENFNRERWPKYWFKPSEKYPLQLYKFGRLMVMGPKNPYPYLKRAYGKWNKGVIWEGHHD